MSLKRPRSKGRGGEHEVCQILNKRLADLSCDFIRTPMSGALMHFPGDIFDRHHKAGIIGEVKRVEKLNVEKAYQQAKQAAVGSLDAPVLFHRRNNTEWLVTLSLADFADILAGEMEGETAK